MIILGKVRPFSRPHAEAHPQVLIIAPVGGVAADLWGLRAAVWVAAAISLASGLMVARRMYETHPRPDRAVT